MDTKKDNIIRSGNIENGNGINLNDYKAIIKKTERIVSALYLVTELLADEEPLKANIREVSLGLIGLLHQLPQSRQVEKHVLFDSLAQKISQTLSYISIAQTIAFISDMNASILSKELQLLAYEISRIQADNTENQYKSQSLLSSSISGLKLGQDHFTDEQRTSDFPETREQQRVEGKEQETLGNKGHFFKGHIKDLNNVLYKKDSYLFNQFSNKPSSGTDKGHEHKSDTAERINRRNNIIRLVRDKKEVNIKDISTVISDCSEKTVQRELNSLVGEGVLKREGKKRWSRYSIA